MPRWIVVLAALCIPVVSLAQYKPQPNIKIDRHIEANSIDGGIDPELIPVDVMLRVCLENNCDFRDHRSGPAISEVGLKQLAAIHEEFHVARELIRPHSAVKDFDTYWGEVYQLVDQTDATLRAILSSGDYDALLKVLEIYKAGTAVPKIEYRMPNSVAYREAANMVASAAGQGPPGMVNNYTGQTSITLNTDAGAGVVQFSNSANGWPWAAGTTPHSTCQDGWLKLSGTMQVESGVMTETAGSNEQFPKAMTVRWVDPKTCTSFNKNTSMTSWTLSGSWPTDISYGAGGVMLADMGDPQNSTIRMYLMILDWNSNQKKPEVQLFKYNLSTNTFLSSELYVDTIPNVSLPNNAQIELKAHAGTVTGLIKDPANKYKTVWKLSANDKGVPLENLSGGIFQWVDPTTSHPWKWSSAQTTVGSTMTVKTTVTGNTQCSPITCNGVTHTPTITNKSNDGTQGRTVAGPGASPQTDISFSDSENFFIPDAGELALTENEHIECSAVGQFQTNTWPIDWERTDHLFLNKYTHDSNLGWEMGEKCISWYATMPPSVVQYLIGDYSNSKGVLPRIPYNAMDNWSAETNSYIPMPLSDYYEVFSLTGCERFQGVAFGQPWNCLSIAPTLTPTNLDQWKIDTFVLGGVISFLDLAEGQSKINTYGDGTNYPCTIWDEGQNKDGFLFYAP